MNSDIERDMRSYCVEIGNRLAGSHGERKAAEYTLEQFRSLGLESADILSFGCRCWIPGSAEIVTEDGQKVACSMVTHSPATPADGIEGEIRVFEPADWADGLDTTGLEGKIGLFYSSYGESAELYRQLHQSPLAALVFVDTRIQSTWPVANGMGEKFMDMVRKPMVYVSVMDAWDMIRRGVERLLVHSSGEIRHGKSWNVVGEIPGTNPSARVIVVCGHLDSVTAGVGADDNASGMAAVLECARGLRGSRSPHTIRFIGFGAEEQLSVGSARYVAEQIRDLDRVGFVCNFDGVGALLGANRVLATGTDDFVRWVRGGIEGEHRFGEVYVDACPYQDQFPFTRHGVPGVWFSRETNPGTYWYHHSVHNDIGNCSFAKIAEAASRGTALISELAGSASWPFQREIPARLREKIEHYAAELFE